MEIVKKYENKYSRASLFPAKKIYYRSEVIYLHFVREKS